MANDLLGQVSGRGTQHKGQPPYSFLHPTKVRCFLMFLGPIGGAAEQRSCKHIHPRNAAVLQNPMTISADDQKHDFDILAGLHEPLLKNLAVADQQ
jgi:hypothetical protein